MTKKEDFKAGLRRRYLAVFDEVYKTISEKKKITEGEFCDILGLRRATPHEIRAGKRLPTIEDIVRICDKYGYDLSYVIKGKATEPGKEPANEVTLHQIYELIQEINQKLK